MLLFKNAKVGQIVHILDRKTAEYFVGKVEQPVSAPHFEPNNPTLMVDVVINVDGQTKMFSIPENLSATYAGDLCLATDQAELLSELDQMELQGEKDLAEVPRIEKMLKAVKERKMQLNPALKEKKEQDQRMERLENSVQNLADMFQKFMKAKSNTTFE